MTTDNARQAGLTRHDLQEFSLFRNSLSIAAKSDGRMQVVMSDVDLFERILAVIESGLAAQSADASNAATGQGLTDERIRAIHRNVPNHHIDFARAIEREVRALLAAPVAPAPIVSVHKTWEQVEQECNSPSRTSAQAPAAQADDAVA